MLNKYSANGDKAQIFPCKLSANAKKNQQTYASAQYMLSNNGEFSMKAKSTVLY